VNAELPDRSCHRATSCFAPSRAGTPSKPRASVSPRRFTERKGDALYFSFDGIQPAVTGYLNECGFEVPVFWNEQCVELMWWGSIVAPQRDEQGWYCALFLPEWREHFRAGEELYIVLAFESFLEWVNGTLATGRWLCFHVVHAGSRFGAADVVRTRVATSFMEGVACSCRYASTQEDDVDLWCAPWLTPSARFGRLPDCIL